MNSDREIEIQKQIWLLMAELRDLHTARTGHPVWTHRRLWDSATSCFECSGESERGHRVADGAGATGDTTSGH